MKRLLLLLLFPLYAWGQTTDANLKSVQIDPKIRNITTSSGITKGAVSDVLQAIVNSKVSRIEANATSGTNTYTATITWVSGYSLGLNFPIVFTTGNTGASTININTLGAVALKKNGSTALSSGDLANGQVFWLWYDGSNFQVIGIGGGSTVTPAALTKTDDTNVTLTLGGSPSTALLSAASLTLGWTGTLADGRIASAATWNAKQNAITFGTGVQTALGVNIGSAGAPVLFNGSGGTPSSLTGTNITGIPESGVTNLTTDLAGKQATLISGTNIKTINSTSLLGSGDITISGGGTTTNALTVDNSSLQLNSGTTFDGSAARTISIKAGGVTNAMLAGSIDLTSKVGISILPPANGGTGSANVFTTPEQYGAVGDGVTNDATALQNAINSGIPVYFSSKTYLTSTKLTIPSNTIVFGSGVNSVIYMTANDTIFAIRGKYITIKDITFKGNNTGAGQTGIAINGWTSFIKDYTSNKFTNVNFINLNFAGIYGKNVLGTTGSLHQGSIYAVNCYAENCGTSFYLDTRSEYNSFTACKSYAAINQGYYISGGNGTIIGGSITDGTIGINIVTSSGGNDGKWSIDGTTINHNSVNSIKSVGLIQGVSIRNCHMFVGDINIGTSASITIENCTMGTVNITSTTNTDFIIRNNRFRTNPTLTVTGTSPVLFNNYFDSGSVPGNMGTNSITYGSLSIVNSGLTLGNGVLASSTGTVLIGGGSAVASELFNLTNNANSISRQYIVNTTSGTGAGAGYYLSLDGTTSAGFLIAASAGFTSSGALQASGLTLQSVGTGGLNLSASSTNPLSGYTNATKRFTVNGTTGDFNIGSITTDAAKFYVAQNALSSSWLPAIQIDPGAHTAQTTATEFSNFVYSGATQTAASGTTTTQRNFYIKRITYAGTSGTRTITNPYGLYVEDAAAGTNGALTNNFAIGADGNVRLVTAGNKLFITEGSNGSVGQTTLVSGTKAITVTGTTTSTRCFATLVTQGGTVTTTVAYGCACTSNTVTITALTAAAATNTSDTSIVNYWVVN